MTVTPFEILSQCFVLKSSLQNFKYQIVCNLYVIMCNYFKRTVKGQFIAKEEFRF